MVNLFGDTLTMEKDFEQEFKELAKPLNEWLQKHYSPHSRIIIEYDNAEVVSGDMAVTFDLLD